MKETGYGTKTHREFKRDKVRIAQTSDLTVRQVSSDLGGGLRFNTHIFHLNKYNIEAIYILYQD